MLYKKLIPELNKYVENHKFKILGADSKDFEIKFLAQGEYNINYIVTSATKKIVLRINTASQLKINNQIKYEYDALEFLTSSAVTPEPYYLDDTKTEIPYGLLTMSYLEGQPLNYKTDLEKAAKIFAKIHTLELPNNHNFIVEKQILSERIQESRRLLTHIWNTDCLSKDVKYFFKIFLDWCEKNKKNELQFLNQPLVLNNTEVNSSNFIIGKKNYLVDWEKPVISNFTQDITQFLIPTTTLWKTDIVLTEDELNLFYKAYSKQVGYSYNLIKTNVELYKPYMYLRALSWCVQAFIEYNNSTKQIVNEDTIQKIKFYLEIENLHKWLKPYFSI